MLDGTTIQESFDIDGDVYQIVTVQYGQHRGTLADVWPIINGETQGYDEAEDNVVVYIMRKPTDDSTIITMKLGPNFLKEKNPKFSTICC